MTFQEIVEADQQYYMNTFGNRTPVAFDHGKGLTLYDGEGSVYQDFFSGIAVTCLGHSHPQFVERIQEQLGKLIHTSSIYYIENQAKLAKLLVERSAADRIFFCSTGAEANEGAVKLAKIYFYKRGREDKYEIITLKNSFHGRTLGTVAATGQEKYQKPYRPNLPWFRHVPMNDEKALQEAITPHTAAIMLEVVQGESGVYPVDEVYLKKLRKLCDEKEILLIIDEVQTGMGRTGTLFGYENFGIEPDIFTLAKGLGNGIPIGAVCAKQFVADAFSPGDHGTTFGGNPLSTAAGCAVMEILEQEKLVENSQKTGAYFKEALVALKKDFPVLKEVRGMGLMLGAEFEDGIGAAVQNALFDAKYLTGCVAGKTLRILPPLILTKEDVDGFILTLTSILKTI